jgi:hypothetical protein
MGLSLMTVLIIQNDENDIRCELYKKEVTKLSKQSGIEILSNIVDMGIIPEIKKTSTPNQVLAALKQFLIKNNKTLLRRTN